MSPLAVCTMFPCTATRFAVIQGFGTVAQAMPEPLRPDDVLLVVGCCPARTVEGWGGVGIVCVHRADTVGQNRLPGRPPGRIE